MSFELDASRSTSALVISLVESQTSTGSNLQGVEMKCNIKASLKDRNVM